MVEKKKNTKKIIQDPGIFPVHAHSAHMQTAGLITGKGNSLHRSEECWSAGLVAGGTELEQMEH